MKTEMYELIPKNNRKSFYGKAKVILTDRKKYLVSYETLVASIDRKGRFYRHWTGESVTTMNHINSFRLEAGLNTITMSEYRKIPVTKQTITIEY